MKKNVFEQFMRYLNNEDKPNAVQFALQLIEKDELTIEELYLDLLTPSLIHFSCNEQDEAICIWKEHFRTSIIRTIIESCYRYVLARAEKAKKINQKVMVLTPAFEYHEIGAIMNTHFMLMLGLDAHYIGANTPKVEILSAIRAYQPDYVALSVTNPYNLVVTKQTTEDIRRFFPEVGIILGGQAFKDLETLEHIPHDVIVRSLDDLIMFIKKVSQL